MHVAVLCLMQEEGSELGQRVKNGRFRWHNCHWLEIVTGESLFDEEDDEDEEEDEDYIDRYLLHSAAELDNPDYFYSSPDGPPLTMPVGDMDEDHLIQYYGALAHTSRHPSIAYDDEGLLEPHNGHFVSTYEPTELGDNQFSPAGYPPRPMSRADYPLASPGMLFDQDFVQRTEPAVPTTSTSAMQLMPGMEDPLAMYSASFRTALDLEFDQNMDLEGSELGYSPTYPTTHYSAGYGSLLGRQEGTEQQLHRGSRVGF